MALKCEPKETRTLALTERSPLGFSGSDVLGLVEGARSSTLIWKKGGSTNVTVDVSSQATEARYIDMEVHDDGSGTMVAIACEDRLEVDVKVAFATEDGSFDESWSESVWASSLGAAGVAHSFQPSELNGSYEITEFDPTDYDESSLGVALQYQEAGMRGDIMGYTLKHYSGGDDEARQVPIASFCEGRCPSSPTE